ncbi:NAD(P)-dependent alcohol dehydrogenase [Pseudolysinimonas yzui]|uniref:NADPH:quinone reductase n=1 Tax=Pseudolysinimonas yzui TaxID=2708254 RepID=A0A8J3GR27_9MICO|nr:NAD(P)-dependent alcohol dehydrogenase [Pseudolysinimonas yzui]GHF17295.1 NADPH:quinone reductase [Pseudolysinimonas yzui]
MRAIRQTEYGTSDVLKLVDIPKPDPGPGEVLVEVKAAGVTMGDWHLMRGEPEIMRLALGRRGPNAAVRGMEVSGVVATVGDGVTRFSVGDEVFGWSTGAFADYAISPEDRLAKKPASISHEEAATSPFGGGTAIQGIRAARIRPGDEVLVIGAGGGVGVFLVQLARLAGARVTGVASAGKLDLVRSLGAVDAVDYRVDDLTRFAGRFAVVFDIAGARPLGLLRRLTRRRGAIVLVGAEGGGRMLGRLGRNLRAALWSPFVSQRFITLTASDDGRDFEQLREHFEAGDLRSPVGVTYALEDAPRALDDLAAGLIPGKAVVIP